jgi:hypothetical protein
MPHQDDRVVIARQHTFNLFVKGAARDRHRLASEIVQALLSALGRWSILGGVRETRMEILDTLEENSYLDAFTSQDNSVAFSFLVWDY